MKCIIVILHVIFLSIVGWTDAQEKVVNNSANNRQGNDDIWIWGYSDGKVDNRIIEDASSTVPTTTPPITDVIKQSTPCDPFVFPKPNFLGRISEIKCQEYIWQLTYDIKKYDHESYCDNWKMFEAMKNNELAMNFHHIVGGRKTLPGEFPHMGAIGWKGVNNSWEFKCGSSLISSKFVLTAAHCSSASPADTSIEDPIPKIVRFVAKNLRYSSLYDASISRIIVHPDYKSPKKYYDIALMELTTEVGVNVLIKPACLWTKQDLKDLGTKAVITGWGVLKQNSLTMSQELQAGVIDVINSDTCRQLLAPVCNRNWCELKNHQFCAGKLAGGVDACQGDSGGPIQVKIPVPKDAAHNLFYVFGVTSFGMGCAQPGLPGVYTRVSSFIDWIEPIVWP